MMNLIPLLASLVIAAVPPPPTPPWDQMTPGVDYENSRIGVGLPLELSYELISYYFEHGETMTQTGIASIDAIGARYGLVSIQPTFVNHAQKVSWALGHGQSDPYPPFSQSFILAFSSAIDIPAAIADYKADPNIVWADPGYYPHLETGQPGADTSSTPVPIVTPQPTIAVIAAVPVTAVAPARPGPRRMWLALGVCVCSMVVLFALVTVVAAVTIVLTRRKKL